MEGFTTHFQPLLPFVRETIDSGEIGDVMIVRAELTYTIQDWANDARVKPELAGGCLLDAGCYCVNAIRAIMRDEPLAVQAFQRAKEEIGVDSTLLGIMRFPGDRLAYMATGIEQPSRACCEVIGTQGRIWVPGLFGGSQVVVLASGEERVTELESADGFRLQLEHSTKCILEGKTPMLPPEDGLHNTAALVALKRTAAEGGVVAVWPNGPAVATGEAA